MAVPLKTSGSCKAVAPDLGVTAVLTVTAVKLPWGGRDKRGRDIWTMACHATGRRITAEERRRCVCVGGVGAADWRLASYGPLNDPTCVPSSLRKTTIMAGDTQLQSVFSFSSVYLSNYSISLATLLFTLLNSCHIRACYYVCCGDRSAVIKRINRQGFLPESLVLKMNDLTWLKIVWYTHNRELRKYAIKACRGH